MKRPIKRAGIFLHAFFLSLDLLGSALTGGEPYETISARLGRAQKRGERFGRIAAPVVDFFALFPFGEHRHCYVSLLAYEARDVAATKVEAEAAQALNA